MVFFKLTFKLPLITLLLVSLWLIVGMVFSDKAGTHELVFSVLSLSRVMENSLDYESSDFYENSRFFNKFFFNIQQDVSWGL